MNKPDYKQGRLLPLVEEFYTLQGEGRHTGVAAYFIRLGGCDVGCRWCDAKYTWNAAAHPLTDADGIVERAASYPARSIVITGGEPLIYPLDYLTEQLHTKGLEIFLETSGSHPWSGSFDWVCLSPKRQAPPTDEAFARANELKVIIEKPEDLEWAESCAERVNAECMLYLQPEWSRFSEIIGTLVDYAMAHPKWRVGIQTHKYMHIP
jgi:organic radical activating enzyme